MFAGIKEKYNSLTVQIKAAIWFLICSFLQKGISTLTTPIFTRLLSTEEYGVYNVFNSWLGIVTIFATLNLYSGVYTQGLIKFSDEKYVFISSLQGLCTALVSVCTVLYLVFRDYWNNLFSLTTVQMLAMLVMIWTTSVFNFWAGEQRVLYKYTNLVIVTLLVSLAKPIIGIVFVVLAEDKVTARILGLVLVEFMGYTVLYLVQMYRGKVFFSKRFWSYALLYNLPLVPHYLSQTVLSNSDRIMIRDMVGDGEAGIYSLAYSISLIMTLFNTALLQTISPWIYQKIKEKRLQDISSVAYISLISIAIVNLLLILCAPEIIHFFAPTSYYNAIWIIPPVAMSVYFMFSYDLFAKVAFYYEKTVIITIASLIGAVLNIILNYIFIKKFGYIAAGYTTLLCYLIYSICHLFIMEYVCSRYAKTVNPYNIKVLVSISGIFVATGFSLLFTYKHTLLRYSLILLIIIVSIIFRKNIFNIIKHLISLRGNRKEKK